MKLLNHKLFKKYEKVLHNGILKQLSIVSWWRFWQKSFDLGIFQFLSNKYK